MKKKVVIFSPIYNVDRLRGSERVNYNLAHLLASRGVHVTIIASDLVGYHYFRNVFFPKKVKEEISPSIRIIRLKTNKILNLFFYLLSRISIFNAIWQIPQGVFFNKKEVFSILKKISPNYIYSSILPYHHIQMIASIKDQLTIKKFIVRPEMHWEQKIYTSKNIANIFRSIDTLQVSTEAEKLLLLKKFGKYIKEIVVIPPLFYQKKDFKKEHAEKISQSIPKQRKIVLFIGKKSKEKGVTHLLRAIKKLWKIDPSYLLITIGIDCFEWKIYKWLYGGPYLLDFDWVSEIVKHQLLLKSDIFCMPSKAESFGLVYLEAWRLKKPIIAYESPIAKTIIKDTFSGITLKKVTVDTIMDAISNLMCDKIKAKMYGLNGYRQLMRYYLPNKKIEKKYLNLLKP